MMRKFIDLLENEIDDKDEESMKSWDREKKVTGVLTAICKKLQFDLVDASYPIHYSDDDREASISIFEEATLEQLQALASIGSNVRVRGSSRYQDALEIILIVGPGIETATIS